MLSLMGEFYPETHFDLHTYASKDPIIKDFSRENMNLSFYRRNGLGMLSKLEKSISKSTTDIYHGHGIWQLPIHQMTRLAIKDQKPYIITPHGMLQTWSLKQKNLKKRLALKVYQFKDLKNATCLHATSKVEAANIRAIGLSNPIAVIPNGVFVPKLNNEINASTSKKRRLIFLSRIVKNKGIEELVKAWSQLPGKYKQQWELVVYGNGSTRYINYLHKMSEKLGCLETLSFRGPVYNEDKSRAFQNADLFVLPTYSENFGVAIAEAMAFGVPVITTKGAPWEEIESYRCGWWINNNINSLKLTLEEALLSNPEKLKEMGLRGRQLIIDKYSHSAVVKKMHYLYNWILNGGKPPEFMY